MCCVHIKHMFIQMRVANKSENNCSVCQLSAPKHHLTAPQTNIWCTCGNGHTIFAEKKKKKPFLELSQKRSWLELRRAKEKQKGDRCFSSTKLAAAVFLHPQACNLWRCVCPSSSHPTNWRDFSQQLAHTDTHTQNTEWEDQKVKGRRKDQMSTEEGRWKHPERDGGQRKGQTCWIGRRAKALKRDIGEKALTMLMEEFIPP